MFISRGNLVSLGRLLIGRENIFAVSMHQHTRLRGFKIALLLMLISATAGAGGFQINMLGMKSASMAGVQTGFGRDVSSVFHNPGYMTFQEYAQIAAGAAFSIPSTSYLSPYTGNYEGKSQLYTPLHLYAMGRLNDQSSIGFSANTPYHLRSKWDDNWPGRYLSIQTDIKTSYFQPTYSYRLGEKVGVGLGGIVAYGTHYLKKALPVSSSSGEVMMELEGRGVGFGLNAGLFFQFSDEFTAGINYRSSVKMKIRSGDATLTNVPSSLNSEYPQESEFETSYTLPGVLTAGAAMDVTRELTLAIDINYTFWNVYDSITYSFNNNEQLNFGIGHFYKNAFAFRLGAQYDLGDKIELRCGVAYDLSPVPDDYVHPSQPDADRFMFSLGGTVHFGERISVDLAYMLQNIKEREAVNVENNFGGSFKSIINIFGITLNYHLIP